MLVPIDCCLHHMGDMMDSFLVSYSGTSKNNSVGCTGFLEQYIALSDLNTFFQQFDNSSVGRVPTM